MEKAKRRHREDMEAGSQSALAGWAGCKKMGLKPKFPVLAFP